MEITILGYIVIPIALIMFFIDGSKLFYAMITLSLFNASSIINIQSSKTGIQPVYFVGTLWLFYVLLKHAKDLIKKKSAISNILNRFYNKFAVSIVVFAFIALISITMTLLFKGKIDVSYPDMGGLNPLRFRSLNITQYIYLLFMIIVSLAAVLEIKSKKQIRNSVLTFVLSTSAAALWGVLQFIMFYKKIQYPAFLFNNNISYSQQFNQMIYGVKRVNSIAIEPSMFALNLIMALAIIICMWMTNYKLVKNNVYNKVILNLLMFVNFISIILTTSTTAYLGLLILLVALAVYTFIFSSKDSLIRKNKLKLLLLILLAVISVAVVTFVTIFVFKLYWGTLIDMLKDITVNKKNLQTGKERSNAIATSINILKVSPLLGAGYGSNRSLDLVTNLLGSTGVLGLVSFLSIIFVSIKASISTIKERLIDETIAIGLLLSTLIGLICLMVSIPDITFVYFWVLLTLTYVATNRILLTEV